MSSAAYDRVKVVFLAVCTLPLAEREAALERECAGDLGLRQEVESLLLHHHDATIFASQSVPSGGPRVAQLAFGSQVSAKWNEEQRQFLHQRLRVWILVVHLLVALVLFRALSFLDSWSKLPGASKIGIVVGCIGLTSVGTLAFALRSPSFSLLRWLEIALLGLASFVICNWSYGWFSNGVSVSAAVSHDIDERLASVYWIISANRFTHFRLSPAMISFPAANFLALIICIYGVVLPQTPRRIISIILGMMLAMAATIWAASGANPDLRPYTARNILSSCTLIGAGGGICAYIGLKFQALRRAIFDAKQVGQYRLTRLLGKGAMGEVYLGQHQLLRRPCAVKLIRAGQAGSEEALVRFEREVQAMAQLTHPNTVEIYDFGRTDDDSFFYAMEYLPGTTLDALVRDHGPLSAGRVVYLLCQICSALSEAHQKGLVHRDIKPSNIFVCERGGAYDVIKLLDFGLVHIKELVPPVSDEALPRSRVAERPKPVPSGLAPARALTQTGQLLGTPAYMPPEQIQGGQPDARSDIYSLGGVACFLLSGQPPFERETLAELYAAHLHAVPDLREQLRVLPPDLASVIARCLAKAPGDRYQDVEEVAAALSATTCAGDWNRVQAKAFWQLHAATAESAETTA